MAEIEIAALAALVVGLACLLLLSLARTRRVTRRFRALEAVATASDAGSSLEETLASISRVLVPEIADFCMIDAIADGEVRRAAVRVAPGGPAGIERWLAEREPSLPSGMVGGGDTGPVEPRFLERMLGGGPA